MNVPRSESVWAWHFLDDNRLRDGRTAPANGRVLAHPAGEPLRLCASGLHASVDILHALTFAPGTTLCRVKCYGEVKHGDDKLVCRKRVIVWRLDKQVMRRVLVWWAAWCAERAQEIARRLGSAGWAAAGWAAAAATDAAATDAAAAARMAAAGAATDAAAAAAGWAATDAAAWAAERSAQRDELVCLVELARKAVRR